MSIEEEKLYILLSEHDDNNEFSNDEYYISNALIHGVFTKPQMSKFELKDFNIKDTDTGVRIFICNVNIGKIIRTHHYDGRYHNYDMVFTFNEFKEWTMNNRDDDDS